LLDEIYNFLNNITITKPTEKYKIFIKNYNIVLENCQQEVVSCDRIFFLYILENLFFENKELENYNAPYYHREFLQQVVLIRDKFNKYTKNETKYKNCKEILNNLVLNFHYE
jgi:hypothetical protein